MFFKIKLCVSTIRDNNYYLGFRLLTQFQHQTEDTLLDTLLSQPESHNPVFLKHRRLPLIHFDFDSLKPYAPDSVGWMHDVAAEKGGEKRWRSSRKKRETDHRNELIINTTILS